MLWSVRCFHAEAINAVRKPLVFPDLELSVGSNQHFGGKTEIIFTARHTVCIFFFLKNCAGESHRVQTTGKTNRLVFMTKDQNSQKLSGGLKYLVSLDISKQI